MIDYDIEFIYHNQEDIQRILDRDLDILVPEERTIELWMKIYGNDPDYELSRRKLPSPEMSLS